MTSTENQDRQDDSMIERLLSLPESYNFDCKRITGKVDKLLETVIAFANADGGMIAIGMEEGVPMMFGAMRQAGLYPPLYWTRPKIEREAVRVYLWNQNRPSVWEQVNDYLQQHGTIGNAEVRQILQTDDPIRTSRQLKEWVNLGLLEVANPESARKIRRYRRTGTESAPDLFSRFF